MFGCDAVISQSVLAEAAGVDALAKSLALARCLLIPSHNVCNAQQMERSADDRRECKPGAE